VYPDIRIIIHEGPVPRESHIHNLAVLTQRSRNIRLDEAAEVVNAVNLPDDIVAFLQAQ
jgi:hypothetical protein